ncbi:hypothetical protein [Microcoleus sp. Pol12A5]|uniref:hypothetical protein n=1 Tax=Microcoleus sp. Pol12A5 TaxID=3055392 RepID=UPI002FD14FF1
MNQSIVKRSLFFLAIFACIQIPIAAMGQPAARSNYEAINPKHSSLPIAKLPSPIPKISQQNSLAATQNLKAEKATKFRLNIPREKQR